MTNILCSDAKINRLISRLCTAKNAFIAQIIACGAFMIFRLTKTGAFNTYYAAAAQAGAHSWKAFLYGALDFPATITVDKPPASLWLPSLAIRVCGATFWAVLLPEVAMCLLSMWLIYSQVKSHYGSMSGWLASFFFASTPLVYVMFRSNNPEALMILLMIAMAYAVDHGIGKSISAVDTVNLGLLHRLGRESDHQLTTTDKNPTITDHRVIPASCIQHVLAYLRKLIVRGNTVTGWFFLAGVLAGFAFLTKQLEALLTVPALIMTTVWFLAGPWRKKILALLSAGMGMFCGAGWWLALVECVPPRYRPYIGGSTHNDFFELTFGYNGLARVLGTSFRNFNIYGEHYGPRSYESESGFRLSGSSPGLGRFFYSADVGQITWLLIISLIAIGFFGWIFIVRKQGSRQQRALIVNWALTLAVMLPIFSFMGDTYHIYYPAVMAPSLAILSAVFLGYLWQHCARRWVKVLLIVVLAITGVQYWLIYNFEHNFLAVMKWICLLLAGIAILIVALYYQLPPGQCLKYVAGIATVVAIGTAPLVYSASSLVDVLFLPAAGPTPLGETKQVLEKRVAQEHRTETAMRKISHYLSPHAQDYQWVAAGMGTWLTSSVQWISGYSTLPIGGFLGFDDNVSLSTVQQYISRRKIHYFLIRRSIDDFGTRTGIEILTYIKTHFRAHSFPTGNTLDNGEQDIIYCYDLQDLL